MASSSTPPRGGAGSSQEQPLENLAPCWKCGGSGSKPDKKATPVAAPLPCPVCHGEGRLVVKRVRRLGGGLQEADEPRMPDSPGAADAEPPPGALVYVVGHGPATLAEVKDRGKHRYRVVYPNGTCYHVAREQILVYQATQQPMRSGPHHLEYLGRAFDDADRNISTPSATFSLVATMVGGGVLSLPYAMSQCGLALGTIALLLSGAASAWTLDMLVDCARCTGRDTFELVGHAAFGEGCKTGTVALVFVVCWLVLVAYFVLLGDLLVPIAEVAAPDIAKTWSPEALRKSLVCVATLILSPMCFKRNLHALRFMCFASVASVVVVGFLIAVRACQNFDVEHFVWIVLPDRSTLAVAVQPQYRWWPSDWSQAVYVFPMFALSFLCHFNALPTHQELTRPTRFRIRRVFAFTVLVTAALYLFIGIFGYLYSSSCTCGNILLNFSRQDPLIAAGRAALGSVLMLNFPLICQPCRNSLYRLLAGRLRRAQQHSEDNGAALDSELTTSQGSSSLARVFVYPRQETSGLNRQVSRLEVLDSFVPKDEAAQQGVGEATASQRYVLTAVLLSTSLLVSCVMQSILVVWSIMGSTVCFLIAFGLPAAFWYRIVGVHASMGRRAAVVAFMLLVAVVAVACSAQTILKLNMPPCPLKSSHRAGATLEEHATV